MDKLPDFNIRTWESYNLAEDCMIDKHNLDEAAENQASLMNKWMDLLYQARKIYNDAVRNLELIESRLYLDAVQGGLSGIKLQDKKPTDAVIKAWCRVQPKYIDASVKRDKAEENVYYLEKNARSSLEHRKAMIVAEKDLWVCGYYSRPSVSNEVMATAVETDMREQTKLKLADTLAKRNRRNAEEK